MGLGEVGVGGRWWKGDGCGGGKVMGVVVAVRPVVWNNNGDRWWVNG